MDYSAEKLLDLLRAGERLTKNPGAENEQAFRSVLDAMIADQQRKANSVVMAEISNEVVRLREESASRKLGPDSALAASVQSADGDQLSITVNAEIEPEGLLLTVDIAARQQQANWEGATITVYRDGIVQDFATTNVDGECQLGPLSPGLARIEILAASGQTIVLPDIELSM